MVSSFFQQGLEKTTTVWHALFFLVTMFQAVPKKKENKMKKNEKENNNEKREKSCVVFATDNV